MAMKLEKAVQESKAQKKREAKYNPNSAIEFLLARGNLPILFWLKKDILEVPSDRELRNLQKFAARIRILKSQKTSGGWCKKKYEGHPQWEKTYSIVETLRNLLKLYNFGCCLEEQGVQKALQFLFSTQSKEGDFRGAYLNEYSPTYHALTLEVLCLYGLDKDKRVQKGFHWIIKNRQNDGGWVIPYRTIDQQKLRSRYTVKAQQNLEPIKSDKSQPFSHLVTGMVLRALATSPSWRKSKEAKKAAELLLSRFFEADRYNDRSLPLFWEELTYPFWATDVLSSLDSLARIGYPAEDEKIQKALTWLMNKQNDQGYWEAGNKKSTLEDHLWVTFAVLRVLKRFGLVEI